MPVIEGAVFDFDGVLVDSGKDIASAVNATLTATGYNVLKEKDVLKYVGHGAQYLLENCLPKDGRARISEILKYYKSYYLKHSNEQTELYNGVSVMLRRLYDSGIKMAVLTNKPEEIALKILKNFGAEKFFSVIAGPETTGILKPDPAGLLYVLRMIETKPERSVMVGDMSSDIATGKNAGTLTCGVTYGLGSKSDILNAKPDIIVSEPAEITAWIINRNSAGNSNRR